MDTARFPLLSRVDAPADLRRLGEGPLPRLAQELREYLPHSLAPDVVSRR